MMRFGLIESKRAVNPVKPLSPCVPRLEFVISKRPTSCRPVGVGDRRKILRAVSQKDRAVELRVAANIVIIAGIKGFPCAVDPPFLWQEHTALKDRSRIAGVTRVPKSWAPFEDQYACAAWSQPGGACCASHP